MNHIRQINLLIKRILCRPAMIVVLLVIPAVLIAVSFLPARKAKHRDRVRRVY